MNTTAAHNNHCRIMAEIQVQEELMVQGITDIESAWGMTESAVAAMWLEDGTATCSCDAAPAWEA